MYNSPRSERQVSPPPPSPSIFEATSIHMCPMHLGSLTSDVCEPFSVATRYTHTDGERGRERDVHTKSNSMFVRR